MQAFVSKLRQAQEGSFLMILIVVSEFKKWSTPTFVIYYVFFRYSNQDKAKR